MINRTLTKRHRNVPNKKNASAAASAASCCPAPSSAAMTETCATDPSAKPRWNAVFLCIAVTRKKTGKRTSAESPHTIGPSGISSCVARGIDSPIANARPVVVVAGTSPAVSAGSSPSDDPAQPRPVSLAQLFSRVCPEPVLDFTKTFLCLRKRRSKNKLRSFRTELSHSEKARRCRENADKSEGQSVLHEEGLVVVCIQAERGYRRADSREESHTLQKHSICSQRFLRVCPEPVLLK